MLALPDKAFWPHAGREPRDIQQKMGLSAKWPIRVGVAGRVVKCNPNSKSENVNTHIPKRNGLTGLRLNMSRGH